MEYPSTPVPNWFFELAPHLSEAELRIMIAIYGQTIKFSNADGTRQKANVLSYTFISKNTGMTGTSAISKALKSLRGRGCIKIKGKRISGQEIEVMPSSPILPVEVLLLEESPLLLEESVTPLKGVTDSSKRSHIKKTTKKTLKENNNMQKFTDSQEESLQLLLLNGLTEEISRRLILLAWSRGHDSDYITRSVGYAAQNAKTNLQGFIRNHIERDFDVNPPSKPILGQESGIVMSKWSHGGVNHKFVQHQCEICHPELIAQREAREAAWTTEDQEVNDA